MRTLRATARGYGPDQKGRIDGERQDEHRDEDPERVSHVFRSRWARTRMVAMMIAKKTMSDQPP